eukprot:CAMPEP_0168501630 /NCGR_PEP_ID=MMETSP0228-20121227/74902_1 /TAXON_ID=133427 /ORGANISM="Protoceratium reticulatum, Strain CCCM 535 (=CCMP 1889)" /LENGTH=314 /DNA_ID=CAMNT_0008518587 /DNA_START=30 /DNA_END=971 /DNA_ORIENTATION=+
MSVGIELAAGGVAGAAGILSTHPLDTIRIRLQSSAAGLGLSQGYTGVLDCARAALRAEGIRGLYKGVASRTLSKGVMNSVLFFSNEQASSLCRGLSGVPPEADLGALRTEGVRGLYKGVASPTLCVGAMNAVLFLSYEQASDLCRGFSGVPPGRDLGLPSVVAAGCASGFASAFITSPTELIKCTAQVNLKNRGQFREEWQILRLMLRDHGWLGVHGLWHTICRETPGFGVYFGFYEAARRAFGKSQTVTLMAGGCAGALAWASIYPLDVLKTRWQTARPGVYSSVSHCARASIRNEGWGVLWNGFAATMIRAW